MRVRSTYYPPVVVIAIVIAALVALGAVIVLVRGNTATVSFAQPQTSAAALPLGKQFSPAAIFAARAGGVCTVNTTIGDTPSSGACVAVDADGYLITASHVVHDYAANRSAESIYVNFAATHQQAVVRLVGIDSLNDLALLKIETPGVRFTPVPLADSDTLIAGQDVVVIGAPYGRENTITKGIISGLHRNEKSGIRAGVDIADLIQTDASTNRGNSGGGMFDARGQLVGIMQQIITPKDSGGSTGVAFAIPSDTVRRSYQNLKASGNSTYAWLGITGRTVSPQMAHDLQLAQPSGVLISEVAGPALDAGLSAGSTARVFMGDAVQVGDQITEIAGVRVTQKEDVLRIASRLAAGSRVDVTYWRAGERHVAHLVTGSR